MHTTLTKLIKDKPLILDGAWGTQLREYGLKPGECPDAWNLTKPDKIERLACSYIEAGSSIILTNTFRANRLSLHTYGLSDRVVKINCAGADIALKAAEGKALVFGSMGLSDKFITNKEISKSHLFDVFHEQAVILADRGVDGIVIESMTDLSEAMIALEAVKETKLPVVVSMIFNSGKGNELTMAGNSPEQVSKELTLAGADIIGANCGQGIEKYIPICRRIRSSTVKPIWIKPSAGLPKEIRGKIIYTMTPHNFGLYAKVLTEIGADFIGGCCGTSPEYIKIISKLIKKR